MNMVLIQCMYCSRDEHSVVNLMSTAVGRNTVL